MSSAVTKLSNEDFAKICIAVDHFREHLCRDEAINTITAIIAPKTAQESIGPTLGIELIAAERKRQIEAEGWTPEHDDEHDAGQLAAAARCYTKTAQLQVCRLVSRQLGRPDVTWPWDDEAWKPSPDPVRNLIKAGALIAAEIDRIQRRIEMDTFSEEVVNALAEALTSTKIPQLDGSLCWCPITGYAPLIHTKDCMDRQKALIGYHMEKHQAVMAARRNAHGIHGS